MDRATFEAVADTVFPVLTVVELNSQGDPLLHPDISLVLERIKEYHCDFKVQTNGTLFSDKLVSRLVAQHGTVMLSLDAVGPKFDEVRSGGIWSKAEPGLRQFLAARDPRKITVGIYPTLTKRTIGEAFNVLIWAAENCVDSVVFHRYVPIFGSWEESPTDDEYAALLEHLAKWAADNGDPFEIWFESKQLNSKTVPLRRTEVASPEKRVYPLERDGRAFPLEAHGDPLYICTAPLTYVEIGLEGQIGACCRAQDVPLGYATSVESFADAWFGKNYDRIRTSLKRGQTDPYPLPNCESCVKFFAPVAGGSRKAIDYDSKTKAANALQLAESDRLMLEAIQKEHGYCFLARLVPGVDALAYSFYEDDRCLSSHQSPSHDEIRKLGAGRYTINGRWLRFSTSDGTDPRRNGRQYSLRRMQISAGETSLRAVSQDSGHCFIAVLPGDVDSNEVILLEDDYRLGPADCPQELIRAQGLGRYLVGNESVYFSTSDNSDPRTNGRHYRLKSGGRWDAALDRLAALARKLPWHSRSSATG